VTRRRDIQREQRRRFPSGADIEVQAGYTHRDHSLQGYRRAAWRESVPRRPSVLRVECRDAAVKAHGGARAPYFYDQKIPTSSTPSPGRWSDDRCRSHARQPPPRWCNLYSTDWTSFSRGPGQRAGRAHQGRRKLVVKARRHRPAQRFRYARWQPDRLRSNDDARTQFSSIDKRSLESGETRRRCPMQAAAGSASAPGNVSSNDLASVIGSSALEPSMEVR